LDFLNVGAGIITIYDVVVLVGLGCVFKKNSFIISHFFKIIRLFFTLRLCGRVSPRPPDHPPLAAGAFSVLQPDESRRGRLARTWPPQMISFTRKLPNIRPHQHMIFRSPFPTVITPMNPVALPFRVFPAGDKMRVKPCRGWAALRWPWRGSSNRGPFRGRAAGRVPFFHRRAGALRRP